MSERLSILIAGATGFIGGRLAFKRADAVRGNAAPGPGRKAVRVTDRVHELSREHWVEAPLEQAFDFFSDALKLGAVTPPWLAFRMLTPRPIEVGPGTLLDYRLRVHGIPIRWQTRIETWEPPRRFVDRQLKGPYKLWLHTHTFEARDGGTVVGDHVRYALPLGPLGELAHRAVVRRDLERIFDYRHEALTRLLGG